MLLAERWRVLGVMTTAQAGSSLVQQALGSLSPVLVATFALSKAQLGVIFSAVLAGAMCCTAVSGALTDRWGERRMLLIAAIIMTAALLGATLVVNYIWLVSMAAFTVRATRHRRRPAAARFSPGSIAIAGWRWAFGRPAFPLAA